MDVHLFVRSALERRRLAVQHDENPLGKVSQEQIEAGRGIKRRRDMTPEERKNHDNEMRRRRREKERRKQERAIQRTAIPDAPSNRLRESMKVTSLLVTHIDQMSYAKARRVERFIGSCAQDVCSMTYIAVNKEIAKSEHDLDDLEEAAKWLSTKSPGVDIKDHEDAPELAWWLMAVIGNRVKSTIETWHRENPTIDSIERLDTALANSGGVDLLIERTKADRAPSLVGARFPTPGTVNRDLFHVAIDAAITERGVDRLYELALNEDYLDSYGRFRWSKVAKHIFMAVDMEDGWRLLAAKTDSEELQGRYARGLARRLTAWMPVAMEAAMDYFERSLVTPGLFDPDRRDEHGAAILPSMAQAIAIFPDHEAAARAVVEALAKYAEEVMA